LPLGYRNDQINDSKQLSIKQREKMFDEIVKIAEDYSIIFIEASNVDELNPKQASINGMRQALEELKVKKPSMALVDAEKIESKTESKAIIK
jgi:ribonuclease HII